jgi:hypothetical protein
LSLYHNEMVPPQIDRAMGHDGPNLPALEQLALIDAGCAGDGGRCFSFWVLHIRVARARHCRRLAG